MFKYCLYAGVTILVLMLLSCQDPQSTTTEAENPNIKSFYYPIDELEETQVYEYVVVHEGKEYLSHYWSLKKEQDETSGNIYLISEGYDQNFEKNQYTKELIVHDGVLAKEYNLYQFDSASQTHKTYPNKLIQNIVYPFFPSLDSVMAYRYECEMQLPPDFLTVKLLRDRKFTGFEDYVFNDKKLEAATFSANELYDIENKEEGGFWKQEKVTKEIYAKGVGLVQKESQTQGDPIKEITRLSNIYTWSEFEKLKMN